MDIALDPPADGTCAMPRTVPTPLPVDTPVYLYVSVKDTGPGMRPEEQRVLFQRFHRAYSDLCILICSSELTPEGNKMIHTRYGGSGLGLFICKSEQCLTTLLTEEITELLGGRIEVESTPGAGSEFRFFVSSVTASPDSVERKQALSPVVPVGILPGVPHTLHILVVEDNPINQKVLQRQLVKAGLTCATADNGQQALDAVFASTFDAILMDLEMPVMDGLTALRHIREAEADGRLAVQLVIALTGNAREGQIAEARAKGMDDVIIKPYRLSSLLSTLQKAVAARVVP